MPALPSRAGTLLTLVVAWLLVAPAAAHAAGSRAEPWQTLATEHFRVHAPSSLAPMLAPVATLCEQAHRVLAPWIGREDATTTQVILVDDTDGANGLAYVIPRQTMQLNAVPPELDGTLGFADNWMWNLILHEYTHVLQIGTMSGAPAWANVPFGRLFAPNQHLPRWFLEGLATYAESHHTGRGRDNAALFQQMRDAAFAAGVEPTLGQLSGVPDHWPDATGWYLFGSFFIGDVARDRGWDGFARFFRDYGDDLIPYRANETARQQLGATLEELWDSWSAAQTTRATAELARRTGAGLTRWEAVTRTGRESRSMTTLRSGAPAWLEAGEDALPVIAWIDAAGGVRRLRMDGVGEMTTGPTDDTLIISRETGRLSGHAWRDLWQVDLISGSQTELTRKARAREPSLSPDGRRVAAVVTRDGRLDLDVLDLDTRTWRPLSRGTAWSRHGSPTWLDDGTVVASLQEPGQAARLVRFDLSTGARSDLTDGSDTALAPHAAAGCVYAVRDRTGQFEAWRQCGSKAMERLTRSPHGVLAAMPAQAEGRRWLYLAVQSASGFDVVRTPMEDLAPVATAEWEHRTLPALPPLPAVEAVAAPDPYGLLLPLLPAQWAVVGDVEGGASTVGGAIYGGDPVGRTAYGGTLEWSRTLGEAFGALGVGTGAWTPYLSAQIWRRAYDRSGALYALSRPQTYVEQSWGGALAASLGIPGVDWAQSLSVGWEAQWLDYLHRPLLPHDPFDREPRYPELGRFHAVGVGYALERLRATPGAISPERGLTFGAGTRLRGPWTGADYDSWEGSAGIRAFVSAPPCAHCVLGVRLSAALGHASFQHRNLYYIGGLDGQDPILAWYRGFPAATAVVRGWRPAVRSGDAYASMSLEYRFPLLSLDRGWATLPVYLGRLHGALLAEAGDAFDPWHAQPLRWPLVGLGAELRLNTMLAYAEGAQFRLGAAAGIGPGYGTPDRDRWDAYLVYGGSW